MTRSSTESKSKAISKIISRQDNLPKGWRTARFDEIAENVNERVDPSETDLDVYVGLEHLDSESLKISRWGTPDDVTGQKLRFRAGDIIFGKRRAYQRKLAVADCDGICSAHAMVLRAKAELVEPDFLPFFMQSDMFMERAIDISVGSLSPTINWKTLRIQEFPLPPKDEQRRIAEIMRSVNEAIVSWLDVISCSEKCLTSVIDNVMTGNNGENSNFSSWQPPSGWEMKTIGEMVEFQGGSQPPRDTFEYSPNEGNIRLIQIRDYKSDEFITYIPKELCKRNCTSEDVMIGRYGPPIFQILRGIEGAFNVALIKATPIEGLSKSYLYYYLKQSVLFRLIDHLSQRSSGQTGIDMEALRSFPFPIPPQIVQRKIVGILERIETQIDHAQSHINSLIRLKQLVFLQKQ